VEEHFYLILPSLLVFFPRSRRIVVGLATLSAFAWLCYFVASTPSGHFYYDWEKRTDLRIGAILFPAFLTILISAPRVRACFQQFLKPHYVLLFLAMFPAAGVIRHFHNRGAPRDIQTTADTAPARQDAYHQHVEGLQIVRAFAVPILFPLLILATALNPTTMATQFLELPALRYIGRLSYSLYLWQQIFFTPNLDSGWPVRRLEDTLPGLALLILCATTSYYLIERPAIRLGHRLAPPATPGHIGLDTIHEPPTVGA
jgi:peptidoglycan/LPS O-acetylase OafA/YrhL